MGIQRQPLLCFACSFSPSVWRSAGEGRDTRVCLSNLPSWETFSLAGATVTVTSEGPHSFCYFLWWGRISKGRRCSVAKSNSEWDEGQDGCSLILVWKRLYSKCMCFFQQLLILFVSDRLRAAGSIFYYIVACQPNVFLAWWRELYHFKSQIGDIAFCLWCCCHRCNGMWSALGSPASRYPLGMFCQSSSTSRLQQTPHCLD